MKHALVSDRVVTEAGETRAAVVIENGRIGAVCPPAALEEGLPVEDLGSCVLMPGLVDTHVHINEPGRTEWEGFVTATEAAAAGGVTSLVDMPLNCIPVTTTERALDAKRAAIDGKLSVDVGYWGGVIPGNAKDLGDLGAAGVLGAKAFLCDSGIDDYPASDRDTLRAAMTEMARLGLPLLAHAELELALTTAPSADPDDYVAWLGRRPSAWEDAAIALLISLCRETGCAVHIVHLSSATALPMLAEAKSEGLPITAETCPHYLCLCAEEIRVGATEYKCAPPIREHANREALWDGLRQGIIDFVVTDHSPCTPNLKAGGFVDAWGGIASLSLGLPSVWTEARARGFGVSSIAAWMSERPARFAGLGSRKGRIAPGYDADLVCWDPDAEVTPTQESLRFKNKVSPYIGRTMRGQVSGTWLRGQRVFDGTTVTRKTGRELLFRGGSQ